ncbi:hypothetical protein WDU94_010286 [Cyamophila willieti]
MYMLGHANNVRRYADEHMIKRQSQGKDSHSIAVSVLNLPPVKHLPGAKPGTFFARDNVSNFISWSRRGLGVFECLLFETDDLIMRKNEKHVILCLLESRSVHADDIEASQEVSTLINTETSQEVSTLINTETSQEVSTLINTETSQEVSTLINTEASQEVSTLINTETSQEVTSQEVSTLINTETSQEVSTLINTETSQEVSTLINTETSQEVSTLINTETSQEVSTLINTETSQEVSTLINTETSQEVPTLINTGDSVARRGAKLGMPAPMLIQLEREIDREIAADKKKLGFNDNEYYDADLEDDLSDSDDEAICAPLPQIVTNDLKSLDEMVRDLVARCTCPTQFPMIRVSEGKYRIGDTKVLIFVRVLRSHVMVRVGGGWDTLSHYLDKHDPCRCKTDLPLIVAHLP